MGLRSTHELDGDAVKSSTLNQTRVLKLFKAASTTAFGCLLFVSFYPISLLLRSEVAYAGWLGLAATLLLVVFAPTCFLLLYDRLIVPNLDKRFRG